jgi:hypothetical protein
MLREDADDRCSISTFGGTSPLLDHVELPTGLAKRLIGVMDEAFAQRRDELRRQQRLAPPTPPSAGAARAEDGPTETRAPSNTKPDPA